MPNISNAKSNNTNNYLSKNRNKRSLNNLKSNINTTSGTMDYNRKLIKKKKQTNKKQARSVHIYHESRVMPLYDRLISMSLYFSILKFTYLDFASNQC